MVSAAAVEAAAAQVAAATAVAGASEALSVGVVATTRQVPAFVAGSGGTSPTARLSFTLDSRASSYFFRDCTDLMPLHTPVTVALANPFVGYVVAESTTTLLCPAAPFGFLTGYYTPSFSRNLVGVSHLHDLGVVTNFPLHAPVASCRVGATGAPLATFHREPSSGLPESLTPLPRSPAPPCTLCVKGRQRAAPHSSSFPPTKAPLQTLHLDVWGPSPVLGPLFFHSPGDVLLGLGDHPVLQATRLAAAERGSRATHWPGHGGCPDLHVPCRFLWPQAVRYAAHQLNLWPSDARPWATPIFLRTGFPGVAADYRVWGCLAHVRAPSANKLSARTHACIFLGFPLDASGWVFYDPVTYQFFASQDATFDESVSYYKSCPHRGSEAFPPPLFLTLEPPQVAPIAPPPLRPAPSGVSHITPQSSPPQRLVPVVSGGAGGAVAEGESTGAAGARRASSGGAGGVRVETTPEEDTAVSTQRPRPASPPGFPSVPQFPPSSPPRPVAAEPGGVPAGGTRVLGGVVGGGSGSWGAGARDTSTATPTPRTVRFLTRVQRLDRLEREERERFERARQHQQQQQSPSEREERVEEDSPPQQLQLSQSELEEESRQQQQQSQSERQERVEEESQQQQQQQSQLELEEESRQQQGQVPSQQMPEEPERRRLRLRDLPDPAPAHLVRGPLPSPPVPPAQSLSSSQWTRRSPLRRAVSPEPHQSRYHADGLFHLVLCSRVPSPLVLPQPPESSLTVLHDPLSDYLRASRPVVSRVLSVLFTHPTAPLSSVSALVITVASFASSHRLDYAAHLVSGPARSPSSGGAHVFPLEVLEDRHFELGFLAAAVPHLCAMLLAPEGDPDALDIPIPCTHAKAVSGPSTSYWIAAEEAEMASYRSTGTYIDAVPPPGANFVSGMWLYKVKRPLGAPPVFKAHYVARGFSQREGVDFFQTFTPTPKMTTLRVLLHIAAQRDYELHSLDFSTGSLQGSLH
ncbi:unnamed protein product [Closterium sp. NIES-54]